MSTFSILRHSDKDFGGFYNPHLRHNDEPINPQGWRKAQRLCEVFHGKPIAAIYVSEYLRTGQTIAATAADHGLTPIVDPRLNELDSGLFEGRSPEELQQAFPAEWQAYTARKADFRFPGGETGAEALARIAAFLEEKRQQHPAEDIIAVCHDGIIRVMMCYLTGMPVYQRANFRVDFCGVTEISYQEAYGSWRLLRFNQSYGEG